MKTIYHCATFPRRSSVPIRCRYIYMYDTYISKFKERMATSIDHLLQRKRTVPDERQGKTDASRREHDFCLQRYICWSLMSIIKQINARDAHKCCCLRKNRDDLFLIRAPMPHDHYHYDHQLPHLDNDHASAWEIVRGAGAKERVKVSCIELDRMRNTPSKKVCVTKEFRVHPCLFQLSKLLVTLWTCYKRC